MADINKMVQNETLLAFGIATISTGTSMILLEKPLGIALCLVGLCVLYIRGKFKNSNGLK